MSVQTQIAAYLASLADPVRVDLQALHDRILGLDPSCRLWFLDGRDAQGKVVSNPNIGYGLQNLEYANGKTRAFYRVGISANTRGISVYLMGLADKTYLSRTYASRIGTASVTGYCIQFKRLGNLHADVLDAALRDGLGAPGA